MFKKIFALILCFSLFPNTATAISTGAQASIVICADTNQILYGENYNKKLPMASTTKIMTAIVALECGNLDDIVTVSSYASRQEGSSIYAKENDKISLEDLLYGLMLNSGNDAAMAIAEHIAKNPENFVRLMNKKAQVIGCKNTHFANPSGLPDPDHYSTAYDMAIIMSYAIKKPDFAKITGTKEYQINTSDSVTYLKNHNRLLWQYPYATGGKTGYTKAAGRCFVSSAKKGDATLIAVTLNDPDDWIDHQNLLDYGFEEAKMTQILSRNDILCTKKIHGVRVNLLSGSDLSIPLKDGKRHRVTCKVRLKKNMDKDIKYGTHLGIGEIYVGDHFVTTIGLISGQDVFKKNGVRFSDTLSKILKNGLL